VLVKAKSVLEKAVRVLLVTNVVDPLHIDTDPDPRICTTDLRIWILLFLSVAFMMPTNRLQATPPQKKFRLRNENHVDFMKDKLLPCELPKDKESIIRAIIYK
jgi:hypothetical protein